jgi:hypothetical protein
MSAQRMQMKIAFPAAIPYGDSLGRLRAVLKPYLAVEIRKRRQGGFLSGPSHAIAAVPFILPPESSIIEWTGIEEQDNGNSRN